MPRLHRYLIYLYGIFIALCILVQMRLKLENMEIFANFTRLKVFIGPDLFAS
jgi:hypothetical protein